MPADVEPVEIIRTGSMLVICSTGRRLLIHVCEGIGHNEVERQPNVRRGVSTDFSLTCSRRVDPPVCAALNNDQGRLQQMATAFGGSAHRFGGGERV